MQVHGEVRPAPVDGRRAVEWHGRRSPLEGPERVFERRQKIRAFAKALLPHIRGPDVESAVLPHQYGAAVQARTLAQHRRSGEHTSELQSLMRISYDVFCLKKKKKH